MIAGIMQPYFFPYIGYIQLIKAVDIFVFLDDAQYINRGWVNRNRILLCGKSQWLTLPVKHAPRSNLINQRKYLLDPDTIRQIERRLSAAYIKVGNYADIFPLISDLLRFKDPNVARFNENLLIRIAQEFGISTRFMVSSEIDKADQLKGEAKIIDLCQRIGADRYVNPIGGRELYQPKNFRSAGIELSFLRTDVPPEPLASGPLHLSIIDGMMRHGLEQIMDRMDRYTLLDNAQALADQGRPAT